jgi:hypothetical protein
MTPLDRQEGTRCQHVHPNMHLKLHPAIAEVRSHSRAVDFGVAQYCHGFAT